MADSQDNTIILTFKHRLLLKRGQHKALEEILAAQRHLYNGALEHRISEYRRSGKTITLYTQMAELTQLRQESEYSAFPLNLQRWTLNLRQWPECARKYHFGRNSKMSTTEELIEKQSEIL